MRLQLPERMQNNTAMEATFGGKPAIRSRIVQGQRRKPAFFIKLSSCRQREIQRVL
jgi:hypothetical protein